MLLLVLVLVAAVSFARAMPPLLRLGREGAARGLAFSPDGRTLFAATDAGLRRWTFPDLRELPPLDPGPFARVTVSPDGRWLVAAARTNPVELRLWQLPTEEAVGVRIVPPGVPQSFAWHPDGQRLALSFPETGDVWQVTDGPARRERALGAANGEAGAFSFSRDGRELWAPAAVGLKRWTVGDWRELAPPLALANYDPGRLASVALRPDRDLLVGGESRWVLKWPGDARCYDIVIWRIASGRAPTVLTGHRDEIGSLVLSPDGQYLASASGRADSGGPADNTARLWRVSDGRQVAVLRGTAIAIPSRPMPPARALCFTPDSATIAVAQADGTISFHDLP